MENQGSNAIISRSRVGNITHVRISGVIDETFPLTSSSPDLGGILVIDLGAVDRISSFGVRKWIEFVSKLPPGAISMYVVYAPPVVVDQLNMVEGFAGVSRVLTVLAPYTCRTCSEDRLRAVNLLDEAQIISENRAPEHNCPVCSNPLEFADLPSEFFGYMRRQNLGTVDPVVMRYLRLYVAAEPLDLPSHLKVVQDDITYITLASVIRGDLNVRRLASGLEGRVAFDFSHVAKVELEGVLKLEQVLETAAKGAQVMLCRVPPSVLSPLAKSGKPLPAKIHSLWLPYECQNCGQLHHQRQHAASFLQQLRQNEGQERPCSVCGGASRLASIPNLAQFLSRVPLTDRPQEDVEALEAKATTQFLFAANSEPQPNAGNTDISGSHGGSKLQIIRRLGQGGMAEVFLAKQVGVKGFEKFLVMKKILQQFAENPEFVDMLFAEARANARLTHPNVVQTFDVGVTEGVAYILMEYVRGPDLKRLMNELRRKGLALPMEHALRIVAETSAGLHYAHSYVDPAGNAHPVVHRDVSPHNILVSLDGAIKLSDFGIAKVQGEDHTQAGVLKGKISYISPEAAAGRPLDARNDVFALGVVLFELLTGQLPFRRDHDAATLNAIVREPAPVPSQIKPSIPQDVSDLILRALVKDPARRTPSAAALREEIEAVMAHHRLNSSPAAVAQFFKDTLSDRLVEYAPAAAASPGSGSHPRINAGTGELAPSDTRSSARLAGAAGGGSGTGSRPNLTGSRPGTGSGPRPNPNPNKGSGSGPRPIPAPAQPVQPVQPAQPVQAVAAAGMEAEAPMRQAVGQQARPSQTGQRPALSGAAAQAPASPSTRSGIRAIPTTGSTAPVPVAQANAAPVAPMAPGPTTAQRAAVAAQAAPVAPPHRPSQQMATVGTSSRPAVQGQVPGQSRVGMQAVAPAPVQAPVSAPVSAPPPTPAPNPNAHVAPEPPSSRRKFVFIGIGAVVLLAIAGGIASRFVGGISGPEVLNLGPGERLYIGGVRADSLPRIDKPGALLVSTAVDGHLRRFGRTERRDRIDVRTIPEALPQPGTGTLKIGGDPAPCRVKVGDTMLQGATPLSAPIEAGKELGVIVTCPSGVTSTSVLAVPGQEVEIDPRPRK